MVNRTLLAVQHFRREGARQISIVHARTRAVDDLFRLGAGIEKTVFARCGCHSQKLTIGA